MSLQKIFGDGTVPKKCDRTQEKVCVNFSGNKVYEDQWHGSCVAVGEVLVKYCSC
jgi:hypothetical protein